MDGLTHDDPEGNPQDESAADTHEDHADGPAFPSRRGKLHGDRRRQHHDQCAASPTDKPAREERRIARCESGSKVHQCKGEQG